MIVQDRRSNKAAWGRIAALLAIVALVGWGTIVAWRNYKDKRQEGVVAFCDMEKVEESKESGKFFKSEGKLFQHGETQTDAIAHSGTYSSETKKGSEYGALWESTDIQTDEVYEISIWRYSPNRRGHLVVDGSWGMYEQGSLSGKADKEGWEELSIKIRIPTNAKDGRIKAYGWNPEDEPVYFDDLSIRLVKKGIKSAPTKIDFPDTLPYLNLIISDKGIDKLTRARDEALLNGVFTAKDESWVNAKMEQGKKQYTGRIRLKGDWTDHLIGDKWSYRIQLDGGQAWNRMVTFSVQNPMTRDFLSEWVLHQWFDREGILTTRYEMIELRINGVTKGLYAYEEHFEKQIAEYNARREGPIMKLDETGLWEVQERMLENDQPIVEEDYPIFKSSPVIPFGEKKALEDSAMTRQVQIAQQLATQYKNGKKTVWELFDAKKVARYYAIIDISKAQHAFIWHNQRWYYNPIISRLEPIGFDGYTTDGPFIWMSKPFIGYARNFRYMAAGYRDQMFERFFQDTAFVKEYVGALYQFTSVEYLDKLLRELEPRIVQMESWIGKEWANYKYNRTFLVESAKKLRLMLVPVEHVSVKAHFQEKKGGQFRYKVFNYHCLPVVLLGVGKKADKMDHPFTEQKLVDPYYENYPAEFQDMYAKKEGKFIFFRVPGIDSLFAAPILQWPNPEGKTPEQKLFEGLKITSNDLYTVDDSLKVVTFKKGKYKTDKDILIPQGYTVNFQSGVEIDFVRNAKFISKSTVLMSGTEEAPIKIFSSDQSANGFTLLQPEKKCEMRYVAFEDLGTLHEDGWNLTGAVSAYEAEILIDHCSFVKNHCEDALNLVRCIFDYRNSYIGYTFGDGFDSDFCHGVLYKANFSHTGNDCIDFSGSTITIFSAYCEFAGDKGISLGEECNAIIESAVVRNSVVGVAAKDLTKVTIKTIDLYDNKTAFTAYQKKPEYGPGTIVVEKYRATGNDQLYVLQKGSTLNLMGELIEGKK
jgi:hypothetical protein